MKTWIAVLSLAWVVVGGLLWGCSGDCEPGLQTECACPGGQADGVQVCQDDGTYGSCDCSSAGGSGGGTTTSTGMGAGGSGGATTTSSGGSGGADCPPPSQICGSACVDTDSDPDHCGDCNQPCPAAATCSGGVCDCPGTQIACGTQCVEGQSDNTNCGGCGHDCQGGTCTGGFCPIDEIANTLQEPYSVAIDGAHVYWFTHGTPLPRIWRADLDGSGGEYIANAGINPRELIVSGDNLYWSTYGINAGTDGAVWRLDLSAALPGTPEKLNTSDEPDGVWGIGLGGGFLYFANQIAYTVHRVDGTAPGAAELVTSNEWTPWDVAADASHVYWTSYTGGEIKRKTHTTGTPQVVASGQASPVGLALTSTHVYWTTEIGNQIQRAPLAGGTVETVADGQVAPIGLAVDASDVYWTNYGNGTVMKAPVEGGATTTLAASQANPYGIAVDATHVYWTTLANKTANGTVARVAK